MNNKPYPSHQHPHGVENTQEYACRIWACTECPYVFADEEIRKDIASGKWGHICHAKKYRNENRCESHLEPYIPELPTVNPKDGKNEV